VLVPHQFHASGARCLKFQGEKDVFYLSLLISRCESNQGFNIGAGGGCN